MTEPITPRISGLLDYVAWLGVKFDAAAAVGDLPKMDQYLAAIRVTSRDLADLACDTPHGGVITQARQAVPSSPAPGSGSSRR